VPNDQFNLWGVSSRVILKNNNNKKKVLILKNWRNFPKVRKNFIRKQDFFLKMVVIFLTKKLGLFGF